jgi:hypothetical protein
MRCVHLLLAVPMLFALAPLLAAQSTYPPAPFLLTPKSYYPNATLFRMDHVGGCPGNGLEQGMLVLHWQSAWYADSIKHPRNDTIRYEVCFLVDSARGTRAQPVVFTADWNGASPSIHLSGDEVYRRIFPPPFPPPAEPDTIVLRVNWFVRARNSAGVTSSDTAGVTIPEAQSVLPTPPLLLSYNRPPENVPTPVSPLHNAIIRNVSAATQSVDVIFTPATDRNIRAGAIRGGFRVYDVTTHTWREDNQGRTIDTLTYQWVGTVVRSTPMGRGVPAGTMIVRNLGTTTGLGLTQSDINMLFVGFMPAKVPDSVVIEWRAWAKDFNYAEHNPEVMIDEVTFRYGIDGTLYPDTTKWSRYGCRPHDLVSEPYRFTLVRAGAVGMEEADQSVTSFQLSQNYPNPFRPSTSISYTLATRMPVTLVVTDALGATVRTLVCREETAGTHSITWDGADNSGRALPSGAYFARLSAGGNARVSAMVLMR